MRIAVIGAGVSGCLAARLLATEHEVTLFESGSHLGGHAQTIVVEVEGKQVSADVAFMVFNQRTYPNFCQMLELLGIASQPSDMSFSVQCSNTGLQYQGGSLNGLFAQRANALRPSFLRMIRDILRFNRAGMQAADDSRLLSGWMTVGEFLNTCSVGQEFIDHYLVPMAAAIWSCQPRAILDFPANFLIGFFANHGLMQIRDRPQWRTLVGGSKNYVDALMQPMLDRVRLNHPVSSVLRVAKGVEIKFAEDYPESFDEVVFATHADDTLAMLKDADLAEREILAAFPYQANRAVLHTDSSLMPTKQRAWASWNYHLEGGSSNSHSDDRKASAVSLTYDLSRLQQLPTRAPLLLTLNGSRPIDPASVMNTFSFRHPAYSTESVGAQRRWAEISGRNQVHFCGAYWGYGFHEDGVNSALAVASHFGIELNACTAACTTGPLPTIAAAQ